MFGLLAPGPFELIIILFILALPVAIGIGVFVLVRMTSSSRRGGNLIPCPDCGQMVSRLAVSCPRCGRPFQ